MRYISLTHPTRAAIALTANECPWCVPQKSISGAVEVPLGNAPYQIGDLLRSAFGIALGFSF